MGYLICTHNTVFHLYEKTALMGLRREGWVVKKIGDPREYFFFRVGSKEDNERLVGAYASRGYTIKKFQEGAALQNIVDGTFTKTYNDSEKQVVTYFLYPNGSVNSNLLSTEMEGVEYFHSDPVQCITLPVDAKSLTKNPFCLIALNKKPQVYSIQQEKLKGADAATFTINDTKNVIIAIGPSNSTMELPLKILSTSQSYQQIVQQGCERIFNAASGQMHIKIFFIEEHILTSVWNTTPDPKTIPPGKGFQTVISLQIGFTDIIRKINQNQITSIV